MRYSIGDLDIGNVLINIWLDIRTQTLGRHRVNRTVEECLEEYGAIVKVAVGFFCGSNSRRRSISLCMVETPVAREPKIPIRRSPNAANSSLCCRIASCTNWRFILITVYPCYLFYRKQKRFFWRFLSSCAILGLLFCSLTYRMDISRL